jgi:phosphoesterase RecJ-like protein
MTTESEKIVNIIKNKRLNHVAIVMHNSPDGDCIGSAAALCEALEYNGKKVDIILQNKIPVKFAPIIGTHRVNRYLLPFEEKRYDVAFILDVADFNRTYYDIQYISKKLIVIDHHLNTEIPKVDCYLNENDSSAGMTVYKIIKQICPITKSIATAIYLTIQSDTENFKNAGTTNQTHLLAAELLEKGADVQLVNTIYDYKTVTLVKLMGTVLPNIKIDTKNKLTYLIISKTDIKSAGSNMKEAGLIIDFIKNIEDIDMAFVFIENNNQVVIKARSKEYNVCNIIKHFGGGGHKCSAGCIILSDDVYKTKDRIIQYAIQTI